jgi:hypothetical protein
LSSRRIKYAAASRTDLLANVSTLRLTAAALPRSALAALAALIANGATAGGGGGSSTTRPST